MGVSHSPNKHRGICPRCTKYPATRVASPWPGYDWVTRVSICDGQVVDFNVMLQRADGRMVMRICSSHANIHVHALYPDSKRDDKWPGPILHSDSDVAQAYAGALKSRRILARTILSDHRWEETLCLLENDRS